MAEFEAGQFRLTGYTASGIDGEDRDELEWLGTLQYMDIWIHGYPIHFYVNISKGYSLTT